MIADIVPERFVAEGLVEALADVPVTRALIARAAEARDVLPDALRERGAEVDVVALYETVAEPLGADQRGGGRRRRLRDLHLVLDGPVLLRVGRRRAARAHARLVSIGPVTSETLREHGREPDVEAGRHDIDGLVEALVADAARASASSGDVSAPVITFLSDYGLDDDFVGVCHGGDRAGSARRRG